MSHLRALLVTCTVACGGQAESARDDRAEVPAIDAKLDPSSPDVLPTGLYLPTISEASCNVNDAYQRGDPMLVVRRGIGANVPLPNGIDAPGAFTSAPPRQDFELTGATRKWTIVNEDICPGGTIVHSLTMTELSESRVAFRYREEPRNCVYPTCVIDFRLDLAQTACARSTDPSCVPGRTHLALGSGAWQEVHCECASP